MARARAGARAAVACTLFAALCLAPEPAHAGVGDIVDDPVGSAGAVGGASDSSEAVLEDTVREVTSAGSPSPQEPPPGPGHHASELSEAAAELVRDVPGVLDLEPQNDGATPASDTSSSPSPSTAPDTSSSGGRQREKAHGDRVLRERTSAVKGNPRTSANEGQTNQPRLAARGSRHGAAAPARRVAPCASGSLAPQDLLRCARAGISLPGLGGLPKILPPAGLVMIGLGLILVACGRLRGTRVGPAT